MCKISGLVGWAALALILVAAGCNKQPGAERTAANPKNDAPAADAPQQVAKVDGPAGATAEFLEAVRTGNDEKAAKMLSTVARQKTAALNGKVTPPASDTARFTVGKVDMVGEAGARVACTWTDIDADGQPKDDVAIWVLRREPEGWRIVGVAAMVFPGENPVVLNFEDPEDMLRQQQWIREEIRRRAEKEAAGGFQAKEEKNREKTTRR